MFVENKAAKKIWVETIAQDDLCHCDHAIVTLTKKVKIRIIELQGLARFYKDKFDYFSLCPGCDVKFFKHIYSQRSMKTKNLMLHVDSDSFWFSAWCCKPGVIVKTKNMSIS